MAILEITLFSEKVGTVVLLRVSDRNIPSENKARIVAEDWMNDHESHGPNRPWVVTSSKFIT